MNWKLGLSAAVITLFTHHAYAGMIPGDEFCTSLIEKTKGIKPDRKSLFYVKEALGLCYNGALGANARSSKSHFEAFGFKNVLDSKKTILSKIDSLPQGAIFILNKKANSGCPVNGSYGHVAPRCGDNKLYWGWGQEKSLSEFVKSYPECISAIMVHPSWKTEGAGLPTSPPLPPEREKSAPGRAEQ